ncbi:MAG: hypothetical protein WBO73_03470 [Gammaproteobacteria bacterium]
MVFFRCLLAGLMLAVSGQSQALFMPDGFTINIDKEDIPDEGCGALATERLTAL